MLQQNELNANGTITPSPYLNSTLLSEVGQARYTLSDGVSNYNALQVVLQERLRNGLQAQFDYTWAKCMSDTPGFYGQYGDAVQTEAQTIADGPSHRILMTNRETTAVARKIPRNSLTGISFTNCLSATAGSMPPESAALRNLAVTEDGG